LPVTVGVNLKFNLYPNINFPTMFDDAITAAIFVIYGIHDTHDVIF